jgi:hypothetical protein
LGGVEHFTFDPISSAREYGWIITTDGKHFDSKECYKKYKNKKNSLHMDK